MTKKYLNNLGATLKKNFILILKEFSKRLTNSFFEYQKIIRVKYLRNKALNKLVQPISNWLATHTGLEPTKLFDIPAIQRVDLLPSQQSVLMGGEVRHHIPAWRNQGCRSRTAYLQAHIPVNGGP